MERFGLEQDVQASLCDMRIILPRRGLNRESWRRKSRSWKERMPTSITGCWLSTQMLRGV